MAILSLLVGRAFTVDEKGCGSGFVVSVSVALRGANTMKIHCITMALFVVTCASASAQTLDVPFQLTPYVAVQGFSWQEFDDNGSEALKESGPRFSVGVLSRYSFLQKRSLYVEVDLQYALGTVDYKGFAFDLQTGARTPYNAKSSYSNFEATLSAGYVAEVSKTFRLSPVAGFGFEGWLRDVGNGDPAGYDEKYSVFLANVGVNGVFIVTPKVQFFSGVVVKFPLSLSESIDRLPRVNSQKFNINLTPGSNPRFLVHAGGSIYGVFTLLYFETWTLSQSPEVQGLLQPESKRVHFGIKLGYSLGLM